MHLSLLTKSWSAGIRLLRRGIVVLVTSQKEGAVTGVPAFVEAVGDKILDATVLENLPDPGGSSVNENKRESNIKTGEETKEQRGQFNLVVGGLLLIAFVVPMAQYDAYVS
ncbi:hypothetical protein HS088_TW11G00665 [Tripterygium wilfordii]|uniref:Uncharacterized protein n=1 Tax=Tripterygium wilfordii TaxID=458696 RepID=A0A7J7D2N0_TRIWF|nr:hypothetical protein HS088_TW11G00665 [Tripterygium wilfordii]